MGKDKKRKRDTNAEDESEQPPVKTQAIEKNNHTSEEVGTKTKGGDRRQIRSERKKKRAVQAQQNALKKKAAKAQKSQKLAAQADLINTSATAQSEKQDSIATGQDFVSLAVGGGPVAKVKRRSPRSIRKEARQKAQDEAAAQQGSTENKDSAAAHEARFICFVGNLPFSVTTEQVAAHFSKLQPTSIRLMTDKKTGKPKGFGFLEFDNFDKMKTCLKLYHHSIFDPEGQQEDTTNGAPDTSGSRGRKINVELTAGGGGGKSASRKLKIETKNKKLNEERARDWEKKKLEEAGGKRRERPSKSQGSLSGANTAHKDEATSETRGDIHPSRMSRVKG